MLNGNVIAKSMGRASRNSYLVLLKFKNLSQQNDF